MITHWLLSLTKMWHSKAKASVPPGCPESPVGHQVAEGPHCQGGGLPSGTERTAGRRLPAVPAPAPPVSLRVFTGRCLAPGLSTLQSSAALCAVRRGRSASSPF